MSGFCKIFVVIMNISISFLAFSGEHATASEDCREITISSNVIDQSGSYCLNEDLYINSGAGIKVRNTASDVVIDLNGFSIISTSNRGSSGIVSDKIESLQIKNGMVKGFLFGVRVISPGFGNVKINNVISKRSLARGFSIQSAQLDISNSVVDEIGGYSKWIGSHSIGIEFRVNECVVSNNLILEVYPEGVGETVAISASSKPIYCRIENNRVINRNYPDYGRGIALWLSTYPIKDSEISVSENYVYNYAYAFMGDAKAYGLKGNLFHVNCLPKDTKVYGKFSNSNKINSLGVCRDKMTFISAKIDTSLDDTELRMWKIRKLALLIEGNSKDVPVKICDTVNLVSNIIKNNENNTRKDFTNQLARAKPLLANHSHCIK